MSIDIIKKHKWFHAIDFGEYASSGRFPQGEPQNKTLYGVFEFLNAMNLFEANVLDLGSYDGIVAFGSHRLGAKSVTAADTFDHSSFRDARRILGYEDSINYVPKTQIKDLPNTFEPKQFDLIVCAGIFYHMLHPMQAFTDCRKVLGDGGILILETPYDSSREDAVLIFNGVEHIVNEPFTYFVPSLSALTGMANLAGFKVLATRILMAPRRATLLLKAVSREELIEDERVADFTKQMLKRDTRDESYRFKDIEKTVRNSPDLFSKIKKIEEYREIIPATEDVKFPHHPPLERPSYGVTRFENADGNTKIL
jgi:2-polyprenyl-3-methyl-5-hydroxy-6-metoxy-1,4-benzoquinol methylase